MGYISEKEAREAFNSGKDVTIFDHSIGKQQKFNRAEIASFFKVRPNSIRFGDCIRNFRISKKSKGELSFRAN